MTARIHLDISGYADWRAACGTMPNEDGTNLTLADNQVTCRKCLAAMGFDVAAVATPLTEVRGDPLRRLAA